MRESLFSNSSQAVGKTDMVTIVLGIKRAQVRVGRGPSEKAYHREHLNQA